jgi:hypothetical protein
VFILFPNLEFLSLSFCFVDNKFALLRDDDAPNKHAAAAPILDAPTSSKELPQKETMVTKSLTVPPNKGTSPRASKCLKKSAVASTSLEAHQPAASSKDVSTTLFS